MPNVCQSKILIIEQNPESLTVLSKALDKAGHKLFTATNAQQGFSAFIEKQPDLVLMSLQPTETNELDTIQAIRHYHSDQCIPVLALIEEKHSNLIDLAFEAGATDFITQPFDLQNISQQINFTLRNAKRDKALRQKQAQLLYCQKVARLGYIEWDAVTDQIHGDDVTFDLFEIPKQDNATLEQFITHVLPKDQGIILQTISEANKGQSHIQISFRVLKLDGRLIHIDFIADVIHTDSGNIAKLRGTVQDISHLHRADTLIQYQSQYDTLTELANRKHFNHLITEHLNQSTKIRLTSVLILDIDRFKKINTQVGQDHGDKLLISVAQRLKRITREGDEVARLGSDEFAILITSLKDITELNFLVSRIYNALTEPFFIQGQERFISYSMGVSVLPDDASNGEALVNHANIARFTAKKEGGNKYLFFKSQMNSEAQNILQLENDLRKAIKNNELQVYYQAQVDANTLKPSGAEALVRWQHPTLGLISPVVFIPLAESIGLINDIGLYVLKTAIKQTEHWHQQGFNTLHIGINLSARQFSHNNLIEQLQNLLSNTSLPANYIDLEITETLAMSDAEHNIGILKALKALGASISIDDFGTGYSSLSYLHSFPIDTIKIDRSFVVNLDTEQGQSIAKTILAMAASLELNVVAEGIETQAQQTFLTAHNCHTFQGFKFAEPMPASAFTKWLKHS